MTNAIIVEKRTLSMYRLRGLCVAKEWYTCGNNQDYDKLLSSVHDDKFEPVEMTTEKLAEIAADIMRHSDMPAEYDLCCVMYELAKVCETCFDMVEL